LSGTALENGNNHDVGSCPEELMENLLACTL